MSKKVVVFGATGTLGAYISMHLNSLGYEVIAIGHRKSDNGFFADYNIPYFSVDIAKKDDFYQLPQGDIYAVCHFAGALPASMKGYDATLYIDSIVKGTYNVLEYARQVGADRIIFPQSLFDISYQFGSKTPILPDSERRAPLNGDHAMYVIAKNMAVDMIEHYHAMYGIKRFVLRLSRVYLYHPNPYTYTNGEKVMVVDRWMIYQAMNGNDLCIWGDPNRLLETCAIGDFLQIVEKSLEANIEGGIYNIGSGGTTLDERVKGIAECFAPKGTTLNVTYDPSKRDAMQFVLDIEKTKHDLGYEPKYNWLSYLEDFKKEMKLQRFAKLWGKESDYTND